MATGGRDREEEITQRGEMRLGGVRQAEAAIAEGCTVAEASRQIGVTQQTFYRRPTRV